MSLFDSLLLVSGTFRLLKLGLDGAKEGDLSEPQKGPKKVKKGQKRSFLDLFWGHFWPKIFILVGLRAYFEVGWVYQKQTVLCKFRMIFGPVLAFLHRLDAHKTKGSKKGPKRDPSSQRAKNELFGSNFWFFINFLTFWIKKSKNPLFDDFDTFGPLEDILKKSWKGPYIPCSFLLFITFLLPHCFIHLTSPKPAFSLVFATWSTTSIFDFLSRTRKNIIFIVFIISMLFTKKKYLGYSSLYLMEGGIYHTYNLWITSYFSWFSV